MQGEIIDNLDIHRSFIYREVETQSGIVSAFYSDHIEIQITLFKNENEFQHMENAVSPHLNE